MPDPTYNRRVPAMFLALFLLGALLLAGRHHISVVVPWLTPEALIDPFGVVCLLLGLMLGNLNYRWFAWGGLFRRRPAAPPPLFPPLRKPAPSYQEN